MRGLTPHLIVVDEPLTSNPDFQEENRHTHIVGPKYTDKGKIQGSALVTMALVNGTPVEALCGFVFVPTRDPKNYPTCEACLTIASRKSDDG